MNAFLKNCFKIAGLSILIGIVLAGIGFSMDNSIFSHMNINSDNLFERRDNDSYASNVGNSNMINSNGSYNFSENYQDVESIIMDITYGTVIIEEGDYFSIEASNMPDDEFNSTLEDGVWSISDNNNINSGNDITIFGINISLGNWTIGTSVETAKIVLTIPKDFVAERLEINLDAGTIKAENLMAEEADIHVGAGNCRINNLTIINESYIIVEAGEIYVDNINANDVNLECSIGNLVVKGIITGDSYVQNEIGNIELNVDGKEEDYNYSVDCGIGTVIINENRYSGVDSKTTKNDNAVNSFTLECGIGKISLKIK